MHDPLFWSNLQKKHQNPTVSRAAESAVAAVLQVFACVYLRLPQHVYMSCCCKHQSFQPFYHVLMNCLGWQHVDEEVEAARRVDLLKLASDDESEEDEDEEEQAAGGKSGHNLHNVLQEIIQQQIWNGDITNFIGSQFQKPERRRRKRNKRGEGERCLLVVGSSCFP